ncbi:MAG: 30S ribosomal protein S16 [Actinomycetota bacterium]|nr:30S ribosomal protein S16 [Actinomycetota bacterium]
MAVKIRLKRMGKIRQPYYRIVVADSRTKRDGRVIEEIGKYHPKQDPSIIEVDSERAQHWLSVGAQPSEPVAALLKLTGDWQKFKGEAAPGPMLLAEAKRTKQDRYNEAVKGLDTEPKSEPVTARSPRKKAAEPAAAEPEATAPPAKQPSAKQPSAKQPSVEDTAAEDTTAKQPAVEDTAAEQPQDEPEAEAPAKGESAEKTGA